MKPANTLEGTAVILAVAVSPYWNVHLPGVNFGPVDLLLFVATVSYVLRTATFSFPSRTTALGIVAFLVAGSVSLTVTPRPLAGLLDYLQYFLLFLVVVPISTVVFRDRRSRWRALLVTILSLAPIAVVTAHRAMIVGKPYVSLWYGNHNQPYWLIAVACVFSVGLAFQSGWSPIVRITAGLSSLLGAYLVVTGPATTAIMMVVVGYWLLGAWWLTQRRFSRLRTTYVVGSTCFGLMVMGYLWLHPGVLPSLGAIEHRIIMYRAAISTGTQAFPLGTGFGSSAVVLDFMPANVARSVHNFVLHYYLEIGVGGLLAFLVITADWLRSVLVSVFRHADSVTAPEVVVVFVFVGYLGVAFLQPPPVRRLWWLLFSLSWGIVLDIGENQARCHSK